MKTKNKVLDVYVEFDGGKVHIEINSKLTYVIKKEIMYILVICIILILKGL